MNKNTILIGVGVLVIALVAALSILGIFSFENQNEPVATVNGEEIIKKDFNFLYDQIEQTYILQGQEAQLETPGFSDQLEREVLNQLISQVLLTQIAIENGYSASQEEVDSQYQSLVAQAGGEEALNDLYDEFNLTEDYIRADIETQIIIGKYIDNAKEGQVDEVTDQEALDYYNQLADTQEGLPEFSEIEETIKIELQQQKDGEFVNSLVSDLSEAAEIEILL
ncbi:MAG: SurA N-terminal domain-containing protein [Candidatus Paceibacterota bacterium]